MHYYCLIVVYYNNQVEQNKHVLAFRKKWQGWRAIKYWIQIRSNITTRMNFNNANWVLVCNLYKTWLLQPTIYVSDHNKASYRNENY